MTIFVGIDWAEEHHDVCVLDGEGAVLASRRIQDGLGGVAVPWRSRAATMAGP